MKKIVVTGAGGFIGGALSKLALERGMTVYGVDKNGGGMEKLREYANFIPLQIDLEKECLSDRIGEAVDAMYDLCWGGKLQGADLYDAHLQLGSAAVAARVCEDAARYCKRFIFASSTYAYMTDEARDGFPINVYGIAKETAASLCASIAMRNGMEYNKVILTNTYGVGDRSMKAVNTFITAMVNGAPLKLVKGDRPNDWVYIDDTAAGLLAVGEKGTPFECYYIGHRKISTLREKIVAMGEVLCPERTFTFGEMPESTCIHYDRMPLEALYRDTGFECKAEFKESIRKTAAWLKAERGEAPEKIGGGLLNNPYILPFPVACERAVAA